MMRLILAIVAFVLAGAVFFGYTQGAYNSMQSTQAQIAQYNSALDKASELQQLKQTLLSRYNAIAPGDLDRLQKLLPDHVDNVRLILDLDNLAGQYGLGLQNVDVSSTDAASSKSKTAIGAIGTSNQKYGSLTLTFQTVGTYDNFVRFLADLESSLRIVDLISLNITSNAGTGKEGQLYTYDITLRTYWLK